MKIDLNFGVLESRDGFSPVITAARVGDKYVASELAELAERLGGEFKDGFGIVFETKGKTFAECQRVLDEVQSTLRGM